ncbi:DNA topoisomerase IV [Pontimicrobium sp. MEBiC06410]|jgi:hypothetical protein
MKQLLAFTFLLLLCSSCITTAKRDCKDFKIGNFKSEVIINGQTFKSSFVRTNTLQIETYNGKIDSSEVRWINDCEVVFKTINPKSMAERKDIHLKILTTTDSSYVFEYSYVGETKKQKGKAFKF